MAARALEPADHRAHRHRQVLDRLRIGPSGLPAWLYALYQRLPRLVEELALARVDGSLARRLGQLARINVLVIDDWGLVPLSPEARRDLLEVFDDRHQRQSTIVTSQLAVAHWHEYLGDPTLADAILDRLVHASYRLTLTGESLRKRAAERLTLTTPSS